ncbi:MAG TPA: hypothetical protein VFG52_06445, partial [Xanthomonadales bacterium]|nr:hypothetical protein [Xanthomonadales bacterium]
MSQNRRKASLEGRVLLVVNTGNRKKRFTLKRLHELGCRLIIMHKQVNWARNYAEQWILTDTADHTASLRAMNDFFGSHPELQVDGVITFWEDDVLLCSRIRDHLGLVGIPYEVARIARDKHLFREFCSNNGLPTPGHAMIQPELPLEESIARLRFPLVVKPVYGSSSAYVVRVDDLKELQETVDYIRGTINAEVESSLAAGTAIMAEEYI